MTTENVKSKRRSIPLPTLVKDFDFYERKADLAEEDFPNAKTPGDEYEVKQTFEEYKGAADFMRRTGQIINEKLIANGRMAEVQNYKDRVAKKLSIVAEIRRLYGDVLSFTDSWHPGFHSQIDGTELYKSPSEVNISAFGQQYHTE